MAPALVVLAAGLGSRYGGLKQIDPVGPSGETLLDYGVFDALRAGFGRVVFVIRRDFEAVFREKVGAKYAGRAVVDYVFQSLDALPPGFAPPAGREKPWGTAHAVWRAREAVRENFAVINADDFYGADSFVQLAHFLQLPPLAAAQPGEDGSAFPLLPRRSLAKTGPTFCMVGFRLANTLSENGAVSRGICEAAGGRLRSIAETAGIAAADVGAGKKFSGDEIVSMNCWGFTPRLFPGLDVLLKEFLAKRGADPKAECYLPEAVSSMIAAGKVSVQVLPTEGTWLGITHREDRAHVVAAIAGLVRAGAYPEKLFDHPKKSP